MENEPTSSLVPLPRADKLTSKITGWKPAEASAVSYECFA